MSLPSLTVHKKTSSRQEPHTTNTCPSCYPGIRPPEDCSPRLRSWWATAAGWLRRLAKGLAALAALAALAGAALPTVVSYPAGLRTALSIVNAVSPGAHLKSSVFRYSRREVSPTV